MRGFHEGSYIEGVFPHCLAGFEWVLFSLGSTLFAPQSLADDSRLRAALEPWRVLPSYEADPSFYQNTDMRMTDSWCVRESKASVLDLIGEVAAEYSLKRF